MAFVSLSVIVLAVKLAGLTAYDADWSSLDTRPLPEWFDRAKFGIFIHWGVFSVPSTRSEWFWYYWKTFQTSDVVDFMNANYPADFVYEDFALQFRAELFDPNQWANILKASGAKYVVLTSKHHEGYTLWPSKYSEGWNSVDVGPGKDLVGLLAGAVRENTDLRFGLYYSLLEWYNPLYVQDQETGFVERTFPETKVIPELKELVNTYKPDIVWSDGDFLNSDTYWGSPEFVAWLYNESPVKDTVVTNDRWGLETRCRHGGFFDCEDGHSGDVESRKWEKCMMMDRRSWGYRRASTLDDYASIDQLLYTLFTTVSSGGNLLLNVGPTADGRILPIFEERLKQIGQWLSINGESIYDSTPWVYQMDPSGSVEVWYTANEASGAVYAYLDIWPEQFTLGLNGPMTTNQTVVTLLGFATTLTWTSAGEQGLFIDLPYLLPGQLPWAWVIKLENVD